MESRGTRNHLLMAVPPGEYDGSMFAAAAKQPYATIIRPLHYAMHGIRCGLLLQMYQLTTVSVSVCLSLGVSVNTTLPFWART